MSDNILICLSGTGSSKEFSACIANVVPDVQLQFNGQCFPLYYYKEKTTFEPTLMDNMSNGNDKYDKKCAITDFILDRCRKQYTSPSITKEDIFYYVYGLLHSPDYRTAFAADLKKMLPRLPLVETTADFQAFSQAGRDLAALHLNYEEQPPCPEVTVEGAEHGNFHVEKMRFPDKNEKSVIEYNSFITLRNIPLEAYEYVINGRSAIEWIMERYQIKQDKASGIVNDPNSWAEEHNKPRYILDLLLSVITVSLKTMKIVKGLPKLTF